MQDPRVKDTPIDAQREMEFSTEILPTSKISLPLNRRIKKIFLPCINSIAALSSPKELNQCVSQKSLNHKNVWNCIFIEKCECLDYLIVNLNYACINLTGYHPPPADSRATNFFHQNPHPRDSFSVQNSSPRVKKNKAKIPNPWA